MGLGSGHMGLKAASGDPPGCPVDKVGCGAVQTPWTVVRNAWAPFPLGFLWHGPRGEGVGKELEASGKTDAQCPAHVWDGLRVIHQGEWREPKTAALCSPSLWFKVPTLQTDDQETLKAESPFQWA